MDNFSQKESTSANNQSKDNLKTMQCTICQDKATKHCSSCKSVAYCSVDHQKVDWKNHKKLCQPFTIQKISEDMGMGWVATRDLKPGFILLDDLPYFQNVSWSSDSSSSSRRCVSCGTSKTKRTCSNCSWPVCSDDCAKKSVHADNECKEFASRKLKYPPPFIWSSNMLAMGMRANTMKVRDPKKFKQFMEDKYTFNDRNYDMEQEIVIPQSMLDLFSGPNSLNPEEFQKLCKICVKDLPMDLTTASTVYLNSSKLNHSCFPNVTRSYSPAPVYKVRFRTVSPVSKSEQFTINYNDEIDFDFQPTAYRQTVTRRNGFICKCKRCLDPTELGLFISGIKCFNCSSNLKADSDSDAEKIGFLVPANPLDIDSSDPKFECHLCHFKVPFSKVKAALPKTVRTTFREMEQLNDPFSLLFFSSKVEKILDKIEDIRDFKDHLHRNHWIIQVVVRHFVKMQMDNLNEMTEQKLDKLVRRLELVSILDGALYPGLLYKKKAENLMMLNKAAAFLSDKFGKGMSPDKHNKLARICNNAGKELRDFLKHEP